MSELKNIFFENHLANLSLDFFKVEYRKISGDANNDVYDLIEFEQYWRGYFDALRDLNIISPKEYIEAISLLKIIACNS